MGLEATLISNVLKQHEFKPLVKAGLTEEDFETLEGKDWFRLPTPSDDDGPTLHNACGKMYPRMKCGLRTPKISS